MKRQGTTILVVEDDANDRLLIERAFRKNGIRGTIHLLTDGSEAIAYLDGTGQYADRKKFEFPTFIITDLKMPRVDGFGVLRHLRSNSEWAVIPTIVLSASEDTNDVKQAYLAGTNSYLVKPTNFDELQALVKKLYEYWIEVEVPQINADGRMQPTQPQGKMESGARR